jgi:hypothetical protein
MARQEEGLKEYRLLVIYEIDGEFWSQQKRGVIREGEAEQITIEVTPEVDGFQATFKTRERPE